LIAGQLIGFALMRYVDGAIVGGLAESSRLVGSRRGQRQHRLPKPGVPSGKTDNVAPMAEDPVTEVERSHIERALAGGEPQRVGWFRFYFADERWEWSPQVQRMHGYEPGTVEPTTKLVLSHKHPDDYRQVAATLDEIRRTSAAFSTRHRIVDVAGRVHHVVVVGDRLYDDDGAVIGTHGFYVDVTPMMDETQTKVTEAVAEIAESRGVIEQAKGMLMLVYRINADSAFELLKWRSQETNVKLRTLAERIAADFLDFDYNDTLPARSDYDRLLLTAHLRVRSG
jgi:ANTAR domain/PAS fold